MSKEFIKTIRQESAKKVTFVIKTPDQMRRSIKDWPQEQYAPNMLRKIDARKREVNLTERSPSSAAAKKKPIMT